MSLLMRMMLRSLPSPAWEWHFQWRFAFFVRHNDKTTAACPPPWRSHWRVITPSIQYRLPKPASHAPLEFKPGTVKPTIDSLTCYVSIKGSAQ